LTKFDVSKNVNLTEIGCQLNVIKGADMDALIGSLIDRKGEAAGYITLINTDSDTNVCTKAQVAVAKAKNWTVGSVNNKGTYSDYAGSETTGTERIADDGNATIVAIYNVNGMKLAQPQPGLNIIKLSNGKVKKMFIKE
jgi:hypothetical protein